MIRKSGSQEAREFALKETNHLRIIQPREKVSPKKAANIIYTLDAWRTRKIACEQHVTKDRKVSGLYFVHPTSTPNTARDHVIRVVSGQFWITDNYSEITDQLIDREIQFDHTKAYIKRRDLISKKKLSPIEF